MFLPSSAAWLNDYIDELATFPNGAHDDAVDSTTQALNRLRTRFSGAGLFEWMSKQWAEPSPAELPSAEPPPFEPFRPATFRDLRGRRP